MRTEEAGALIKRLPGAYHPLHREDWHQMKGWYWAVVDCATPPARVNLDRIMADWVELYCCIPPPFIWCVSRDLSIRSEGLAI